MGSTAFVQFVSAEPAEADALDALRRCDDIEVTVTTPDPVRTDGGATDVDCVVVDTATVSPDHPIQRPTGDTVDIIRCASDPPADTDGDWVEVGSIAGRRTLVNRVRYAASQFEPVRAASDAALVRDVAVPGYVLDGRGRFVAVNEEFVELTAYDRRALLGSHASMSLTETIDAEFRYGVATRIRVNSAAGGTIECLRDAGVAVASASDGTVTRTVGVLRPQSDQRLIERDPAILKRAIDAAHTPLSLSDPTQEDNPLVYVNDAFERTTGYRREDVLGENCRFLQGEETQRDALDELQQAIEDEVPTTVELKNYRADGSPFWNRVTVTPIYDQSGTLVHFLGSQEDITDRKAVETDLRDQRDGLQLLNQIVRHDIRNDLQTVLLYLGEIAERTDGDVSEFATRAKSAVKNSTELTRSARALTTAMLRTDTDLKPIPLRETLESEVERVEESTQRAATITVDSDVPRVTVQADELLGAVFRNLLKNAVVHNGGDIEVRVSATTDTESVTLTIADNGPGISDERKTTIFDRGETSGASSGSGIGLDLVETLMENYDGAVWVEDRQGGASGAAFKLRLNSA